MFPPEQSQPEARGPLQRRGQADLERDILSETQKWSMKPARLYDLCLIVSLFQDFFSEILYASSITKNLTWQRGIIWWWGVFDLHSTSCNSGLFDKERLIITDWGWWVCLTSEWKVVP